VQTVKASTMIAQLMRSAQGQMSQRAAEILAAVLSPKGAATKP
jgi:hypothetical protein